MPQSDREYVQSCLDGRPEMFRLLVERYQTALVGQLRATLGNASEAEEVAQETFVRAYFALGKLQKPDSFFSWLVGIAGRVARENRRAAKRMRPLDTHEADPPQPEVAEHLHVEATVGEAVAKLPDVYREVIALRFYGGRCCQEISRDLDVPLGTVTKRLSRAYALLRERLGDCPGFRSTKMGPSASHEHKSDDEVPR